MAREYVQRERRLIQEFLQGYAPGVKPIYNARLGPYPPGFAARVQADGRIQPVSPGQLYADAALIFADHVELWEGKINLDGQAIGQILVYREAWKVTPEAEAHRDLPVMLHIVAGYANPLAVTVARQLQIDVRLYTPGWLQQMAETWNTQVSRPLVGGHHTLTEQAAFSEKPRLG